MLRVDSRSVKDCKDCKHYFEYDEFKMCFYEEKPVKFKHQLNSCENERKGDCGADAKYFEVKDEKTK